VTSGFWRRYGSCVQIVELGFDGTRREPRRVLPPTPARLGHGGSGWINRSELRVPAGYTRGAVVARCVTRDRSGVYWQRP
jgi:hypothetical protein